MKSQAIMAVTVKSTVLSNICQRYERHIPALLHQRCKWHFLWTE